VILQSVLRGLPSSTRRLNFYVLGPRPPRRCCATCGRLNLHDDPARPAARFAQGAPVDRALAGAGLDPDAIVAPYLQRALGRTAALHPARSAASIIGFGQATRGCGACFFWSGFSVKVCKYLGPAREASTCARFSRLPGPCLASRARPSSRPSRRWSPRLRQSPWAGPSICAIHALVMLNPDAGPTRRKGVDRRGLDRAAAALNARFEPAG